MRGDTAAPSTGPCSIPLYPQRSTLPEVSPYHSERAKEAAGVEMFLWSYPQFLDRRNDAGYIRGEGQQSARGNSCV